MMDAKDKLEILNEIRTKDKLEILNEIRKNMPWDKDLTFIELVPKPALRKLPNRARVEVCLRPGAV